MDFNNQLSNLKKVVKEVTSRAAKSNVKSVIVISTTLRKKTEDMVVLPLRETKFAICGAVTVYEKKAAEKIGRYVDGKVDYILVDAEQKIRNLENIVQSINSIVKKSKVLTFKNNDTTALAADSLISNLLGNVSGKKIAIIGSGNIGSKVALQLVERGAKVLIASSNIKKSRKIAAAINILKTKNCKSKIVPKPVSSIAKNCDLLIGFTPGIPVIDYDMVHSMKKEGIIIDGGVGTIQTKAIRTAHERGIRILRLDIRPAFSGLVSILFETEKFQKKTIGFRNFEGIGIVAGGMYGNYGDVIVDKISNPSKILGIADGKGGILRKKLTYDLKQKLRKIELLVIK